MPGLVAQKIQMTQLPKNEEMVPVTILYVPKNVIAQVKTESKEGYNAVVVNVINQKGKNLQKKELCFNGEDLSALGGEKPLAVGDEIPFSITTNLSSIDLTGVSKGLGFTGAMKRWNFKGGPGGHGSKFHRALGTIGCRKPRRTKPGRHMHGREGTNTTTLHGVPVELVDEQKRLIAVRGAVPGARNSFVYLQF